MYESRVEQGNRNVDIQRDTEYGAAQNEAANRWVNEDASYGGSAEALALKQAFVLGSNTALQFPQRHVKIIQAVIAGRKWGMAPRGMSGDPSLVSERGRHAVGVPVSGNRRLVMTGHKRAEFHTMDQTIDNAAFQQGWTPRAAKEHVAVDHDERRKQRIEDAIVRGDDL
jgi:hypothetical protein